MDGIRYNFGGVQTRENTVKRFRPLQHRAGNSGGPHARHSFPRLSRAPRRLAGMETAHRPARATAPPGNPQALKRR